MEYIKRDLEETIKQASKEYPVLIVTGGRQVGKTTMLKKLMEGTDRTYISLDDLTARKLAVTDPDMFFQLYPPPVFIDEIQYAPDLFPRIKIRADTSHRSGDFWLSGSQPFRLMRLAGESLAGRATILHLPSLSQKELFGTGEPSPLSIDIESLQVRSRNRKKADVTEIFKRIFNGSMPALATHQRQNRELFYSSFVQSYIERDARELSGDIDSLQFMDFLVAVAARCSQMLNVSDIGKELGLRSEKVKAWLGILEKSDIIFYLHPYSDNTITRLIKSPKVYFYDSGLVAYLTKWPDEITLRDGAMSGAILENYAVSEIYKGFAGCSKEPDMYYYRDKNGKEIDLILISAMQTVPLEIKKTASPDRSMVSAFTQLDKGRIPRGMGAILCMKEELSALDGKSLIVPVWMI